jgi:hypothetical protein
MKYLQLFEEFTVNTITCDSCGWDWKIKDGGDDVFLCHKCNHDNTPNFIGEAEDKEKTTSRAKLAGKGVNTALDKKAKSSGVPIGIIRAVMRRGMGAWNSSHHPGVPQEAWGYARVNAFLDKGKGTWQNADKDLAKEVRDSGKDSKLPWKPEKE